MCHPESILDKPETGEIKYDNGNIISQRGL